VPGPERIFQADGRQPLNSFRQRCRCEHSLKVASANLGAIQLLHDKLYVPLKTKVQQPVSLI
jgi:hypothetical protein